MQDVIKLAVVDDQDLFRECFTSIVSKLPGIEITVEANNGKDLLEKLKSIEYHPDVVLLDLDMPVMNGVETTRRLRSNYPNVKIIILSMHDEQKYIFRMLQLGIHGYLAKNAQLEDVQKAITSVHKNGFYFNEKLVTLLKDNTGDNTVSENPKLDLDFTKRELEVLKLICLEYTTIEISERLFLSERTIEGHRQNLISKTNSRNIVGLVVFAVKNKLVEL